MDDGLSAFVTARAVCRHERHEPGAVDLDHLPGLARTDPGDAAAAGPNGHLTREGPGGSVRHDDLPGVRDHPYGLEAV